MMHLVLRVRRLFVGVKVCNLNSQNHYQRVNNKRLGGSAFVLGTPWPVNLFVPLSNRLTTTF
jgi:hypothetical protein